MARRFVRLAVVALLLPLVAGCCCRPKATSTTTTTLDIAPEGTRQVFIDVTTVRIPAEEADSILGALRHRGATQVTTLSTAQARKVKAAWEDSAAVRIVAAPKMLALEGQEASLFIGETIHFAKTQARTNERGGLEFSIDDMADSPVFLGHKLRIVATASADGTRIHLDYRQLFREPRGSFDKETIARHNPKSFLREHVLEDRVEATVEIPDGGHALLGSPHVQKDADGRHLRITLLSARLLAADPPMRAKSLLAIPPLP